MFFFSINKQNFFKNIQQQKEINFFIPKKYTILYNKDLSSNSHIYNNFNLLKNKSKRIYNSCDKIQNPYSIVYLKSINEDSKKFKLMNKMSNNNISLKNEEKKDDDKFSLISTIYSFKNSIINSNYLKTPISNFNEKFSKEDLECLIFGFENIGHTCYINSFLQILFRTPTFLKKLE